MNSSSTAPVTLPKPWPLVGRLVVVAVAIFGLVMTFLSYQVNWDAMLLACQEQDSASEQCSDFSVEQSQALETFGIGLDAARFYNLMLSVISILVCYSIAGLILWRGSDNWLGLLTALWMVVIGANTFLGNSNIVLSVYHVLRIPTAILTGIPIALLIPFLGLFPDGRFFPGWMRLLVIAALPLFFIGNTKVYQNIGLPLGLIAILTGIIAQIIRYRNVSTPLERQQTKIVLTGAVFFFIAVLLVAILLKYNSRLSYSGQAFNLLFYQFILLIAVLSLPISVGIALLRYRLWDVDVLIRRTLVYGALTITLGLVFFGAVALLQSLFQAVSGQQSAVSVVISTLVIAALFNPLRKRLQDTIDRRFYRRKYDAEQALKRFNELSRSVTDVEHLSAEMLKVVQETMQPEVLGVWIRPAKEGKK